MKTTILIPIRLKIMVALLLSITVVVGVITFLMANLFHEDKRTYIHDWVNIAALTTAEECRSQLEGYQRRLDLYSRILLDDGIREKERQRLLQEFFVDLPELVELVLLREGQELRTATDRTNLEAAGLDAADLRRLREGAELPLDELEKGKVWVHNTTPREDFPAFRLAFSSVGADGEPLVISALLRTDELLSLGSRFRVFEIYLADSEGRLLAHPETARLVRGEPALLPDEVASLAEDNRASTTLSFEREGRSTIGGFATAEVGGVTSAALIPGSATLLASRDLLSRLLLVAFVLLIVVALGGLLWSRGITRHVERLARATRRIAKGEFDVQVDVTSRDEIGRLARSFNRMAGELHDRERALREAQAQLVQSEKMAAFGQLGAGIAHEVKNPLAGILGCAQLSLMELEEGTPVHDNVAIIERETERCKTIIDNLLRFARQEKTATEPTELNTVVRDAAAIVNHQLELNQVKLITELDAELPLINGSANQLQQVLMNLMINAQQAMGGEPGTVTVITRQASPEAVEVVVRDTGPGIPKDIQEKLFEPFFTTKPAGKGTGLGLSVSYGIVRDHGGKIRIDSTPGEGATFTIRLPRSAASAEPEAVAAGA